MARAVNKSEKTNKELAKFHENPPFALVESFRNLSTNIGFAIPKKIDESARIVCISSAVAGEGKTTVSVNLATSLASAGAKTLLMDCDMRKPSVRKFFGFEEQKGSVEYLSGQAELNEVIVKNVSQKLDIIAGRKPAPNPLLLLKGERFEPLLKTLAKEYDYIIIDTPPLGIVSDALTIAECADGMILVARQMVSKNPIIRQAVSDIEFSGVNLLGFVLNDYKAKNGDKGYYGKYKYKYKSNY